MNYVKNSFKKKLKFSLPDNVNGKDWVPYAVFFIKRLYNYADNVVLSCIAFIPGFERKN